MNAMPSSPLEIALAQLNAQDDVTANLDVVAGLAERARAGGARLLALPENFAFMADGEEKRRARVAEPITDARPSGPILGRLAEIARATGLTIAGGGVPIVTGDPDRPTNSHVVVGPDGGIVARYDKIHLFDVDLPDGTRYRESSGTTPGSGETVFDLDGWRFGLSICYDLRFPELYRRLVDRGAHVLLVPAAFAVPTGKDHWHVLQRARAIESQTYVVAAAQWGKHPGARQTYGKSLVADPWGDVIAQAPDGVGLVRATLDPERLASVRRQLPCLAHRRLER
jgi:predicted amidohydrolase